MPNSNFEVMLARILDAHMACEDLPFRVDEPFVAQCDDALREGTIHLQYLVKTSEEILTLQQTAKALMEEKQRLRETRVAKNAGHSHTHILAQMQERNHILAQRHEFNEGGDALWPQHMRVINQLSHTRDRVLSLSISYQDARSRFESMHPLYKNLATFLQIVGFESDSSYGEFHHAYVAALIHLDQADAYPSLRPCTPKMPVEHRTTTPPALTVDQAANAFRNAFASVVTISSAPDCFPSPLNQPTQGNQQHGGIRKWMNEVCTQISNASSRMVPPANPSTTSSSTSLAPR